MEPNAPGSGSGSHRTTPASLSSIVYWARSASLPKDASSSCSGRFARSTPSFFSVRRTPL
ncbi:hypothetical protein VSR01_09590 [Actinacidiphila sp. DG2A-62]|uniref:hypothetical protein n=1 Tax=Actinacidiphila sp. DG2A-62 TaxID=3108821 RepID=UPI002DB89A10|nr:hypothetical protein [Actinacidiphila sp. DG2A-62]MEC3993778.1 hypothetical protein [Actinacidiphila sp. DG2A-62]